MDFRILGPIEAIEGDTPRALGGSKQRALLGMLLLQANEVVSSDRLIDELWPGERRQEALKSLQVAVSRLRKALEPDRPAGGDNRLIVTRAPGYMLQLDPERLDAARFERLAEEGRAQLATGDVESARARLEEGLSLWRGPPLADLAYESFVQREGARLEELRMATIEERVAADLKLGRHAALIGELRTLVMADPLRERLRSQLMLALYRSGRQAEALEAYGDARRALVGELGIEPGPELRSLHQEILEQDPSLAFVEPAKVVTHPSSGVFIGREPELAELVAGLDDVFAGHGRLFLVAGEPGIGKSRLAEELIRHATGRGARALVGRCWEAGGAPAYWPWVQALRDYARESGGAALSARLGAEGAELAQLIPELRSTDVREPGPLRADGARFRLFGAVARLLQVASEDKPVVLVLDDLHAADAPSLLLLRFVTRELASTRVLVLAAYRDVAPVPGESLAAALAELALEPVARRLSLRGLSEHQIVEYVEQVAEDAASPELALEIHQRTDGNPLFVAEFMRLLSVEGVPPESRAGSRLAIPESIQHVIARRLDYLSDECSRVLVLASVIGREFPPEVLSRLAGLSDDELLDTLDEAMAARVVNDVPGGGGLRFAHVIIRDALYEALTEARRIRLHGLAVEALEGAHGEQPGPHLAELAYHSMAARDFEKARLYARAAGDRALNLLAYEEAARLYRGALKAHDMGRPDEGTRCELLLSLGEAEMRAGNAPLAKSAFLDAAGIARDLGLGREFARAAAGYGGRIVWARAGEDVRLVPLLEEALEGLGEEDAQLRARLTARLAGALRDDPSAERRDSLSAEAVAAARRAQDSSALAYALDGRAASIISPATIAERLALGTELLELARRNGDPERIVQGHFHRIMSQLQVGDVRAAEADLHVASQIARELRMPAQVWQTSGTEAMLAIAAGRLDEAEELVARALELGERAQPTAAIPVHALQRYTLADFRGCLGEAEPAILGLVEAYPARLVFRCSLAYLHARLERLQEARQILDELASDDFSALPFDQEWLFGMSLLAETCAVLGDTEHAGVLYPLLRPWARLNAVDQAEGIRGSVARYLGILATTRARWDEAELHFEEALAMNRRMEARPWLAHTAADYARMLRARDAIGDSERARDLLDSALSTYGELGMDSWAAAAR